MKKSLTSILILVLSFLLTGCNLPLRFYTKMPAATTATTTSASTTAEPDAPLPPAIVTVNTNPAGEPSSDPSKLKGVEPNEGGFGMAFECSEGSFTRGEKLVLTVSMTNNTGIDYKWKGSYLGCHPKVELICEKNGGVYQIGHEMLRYTDDHMDHIFSSGHTRIREFIFKIPKGAPTGDYTLRCSFRADKDHDYRGDVVLFEGYFRLEE